MRSFLRLIRLGRGHVAWTAAIPIAALVLGACIASAPSGIHRHDDDPDAGDAGDLIKVDASPPENPEPEASTPDPHAVIGAEPAHGPFLGGQRVLVHGKGFTSKARIWFGDTEVDPSGTIPVDPARVQVIAPPGKAGLVDITVQNGDDASTKRTLAGGYTYDALYAVPDNGPVPGGTVIEIVGQGTSWDATTVAKIDNKPCTTLTVDSPTQLTCTVPAGSPGAKTIAVTTGSETVLVLDAYTYADSDNGYKGGLSGAPLAGHLKVLIYDNYTGEAIPGSVAIVGSDIATAIVAPADATGVAVIDDPSLTGPRTVTVAGKCHSPISFIAEPVDTVTVYLDPTLTPACAGMGDPPPVGGKPLSTGTVTGEIVWPQIDEFKKGGWSNVPNPVGPNEHQAAYVFVAAGDPSYTFQLPYSGSAILPTTPGERGYQFSMNVTPGNRSLYAIAGIEDDTVSPPKFTAYAFGAINGVPVLPGQLTSDVFIDMKRTLDLALPLDVKPPPPGPKGPDRLKTTVAVRLGPDGYALLPGMQKSPFLPVMGQINFVGLPLLDAGSVYVTTARAVTGSAGSAPLSVIGRLLATTTSQPLDVSGFVNIPLLATPAPNTAWDGKSLAVTFASGGASVDLTVFDISAGNGVVHWAVAAAGGAQAVTLPDLSGFPDLAVPPGPINIAVYGGHIDGFDYTKLLTRQMRPTGMTAYSLDYFNAHL
ncbi:MAG: IPT/TIG domain-containing protein [Minicystis sp.]